MSEQQSMFGDVERERVMRRTGQWPRIETPAARTTDPETSHEAATEITGSGARASQQRAVVALVRRYPGQTAGELAEHVVDGLPRDKHRRYIAIQRRVSEVSPQWIRRGEKRRCPEQKRIATTLWPAESRG